MNIKMQFLTIIAVGMLTAMSPVALGERLPLVWVGATSCGKFIAETKGDKSFRIAYYYWARGFLSGLNYEYSLSWESATDLSDHSALRFWIRKYCDENPLDTYGLATSKLWHELRFQQGLDPDPRFDLKD